MHGEPKQNTPSADGGSERSNADGGVAEWPRTGAFEDRSNRGLERPRTGAAEGCTNEQDEHRSGQSGQAPRTSAAEDQITKIEAGESADPRGSNSRVSEPRVTEPRRAEQRGPIRGAEGAQPRVCEPRGSIEAAARITERLSRAAEGRNSRPPNWLRRNTHELRAPERQSQLTKRTPN